jgi:hypothetical protein
LAIGKPNLLHVILGCGCPVALQRSRRLEPVKISMLLPMKDETDVILCRTNSELAFWITGITGSTNETIGIYKHIDKEDIFWIMNRISSGADPGIKERVGRGKLRPERKPSRPYANAIC